MGLLAVGTRVTHFEGGPRTHGLGTIVAYNGAKVNEYAKENLKDAAEIAGKFGMIGALVNSIYDGERCPYVVKWDNGYQDVYELDSVRLAKEEKVT